jgi:hypothetical protein
VRLKECARWMGGGDEALGVGVWARDGEMGGCPRQRLRPALKAMAEGKTPNWSWTWYRSRQGKIGWVDSSQAETKVG